MKTSIENIVRSVCGHPHLATASVLVTHPVVTSPSKRCHLALDKSRFANQVRGMSDPILLDARGLLCPLPVLKARKRLSALSDGAVLKVLADDPAAVIDVPHFCTEAGHALIDTGTEETAQVYFIRKGG